jgi:hypothetical protein
MKKIILVAITLLVFSEIKSDTNCHTNNYDVIAARTEDDLTELRHYLSSNDLKSALHMVMNGDAFVVNGYTKITIVKSNFTYSYVRLNNGINSGRKVYILNNFINC